jgi:NitT/TauT family transport system substrate-binding protein
MKTPMLRLSLIAAALAVSGTLPAQAADANTVTIMVGGINKIIYLPAKLTEALGYFKDEGLTVELQSQPAGVDAENQLIAGAVQGVVGFYDHTIDLQAKGKEVEAIAVFGKVPGEVELVSTKAAPSFKSMADAKGKTLGVTGLGSSTDFLTLPGAAPGRGVQGLFAAAGGRGQHLHRRHQAGPHPGRHDHRAHGVANAQDRRGQGAGGHAHRGRHQGGAGRPLPGAQPVRANAWADSHKEQATKLAHAFAKTMQYIHTHSAEEIADKMPRDFYGNDKALYVAALKARCPCSPPTAACPRAGRRRC